MSEQKTNTDAQEKQRFSYILAVLWLSMIASLVGNIEPVFLGIMADTFSLTAQQTGYLGGVELLGVCLASLCATYWFPKANLRLMAMFALIFGVMANFITGWVDDFYFLLVLRFLIGFLASGILYALILGLIGKMHDPSKVIAWTILLQISLLSVNMLVIPILTEHLQLFGVLYLIVGFFCTGLLFIRYLPRYAQDKVIPSQKNSQDSQSLVVPMVLLGVLLLLCSGLNSVWSFIERIGNQAGYSNIEIGQALAIGTLLGCSGAAVAAVLGQRIGHALPMIVSLLGQILVCLVLFNQDQWLTYLLAILFFNFFWNLILPYLMGMIADRDNIDGRAVVLIPAAQFAGSALGPVLAGLFAGSENYRIACWVAIALFMLCLAVLIPLLRTLKKRALVLL